MGILIPFRNLESDPQTRKCINQCLNLDYKNFDIILLPDYDIKERFPMSKVLPTGPIVPALKRNKAIFSLDYEFFASIDSDAYPDKDWLKNTIPLFKDERIGAVGGPNLTPPDATPPEQAAIDIVYSRLGLKTGYHLKKYENDYSECRELASSNLIMRRSVLLKIKGYHTDLATGEDTILSFNIRKVGKKIIYSPNTMVYHHRRKLFLPHLSRIFEQASDKVLVLIKFKRFRNFIYFIPSLFVLFLFFGFVLSLFVPFFIFLYTSVLILYLILILLEASKIRHPSRMVLFIVGLPLTHIAYGLGYLDGLLFKRANLKKIFS